MKVLVVEDDSVTRHLLCLILRQRQGYEVFSAASAEEAQHSCRKNFFPLIILDLNLPQMNGLDFSRWLRQQPNGDRTYILVGTASATGEGSIHTLGQILESGADDYIAKPYNPALLKVRLAIADTQVKQIAQRKNLEAALKRETEFVSTVVNTASALIVVLDSTLQVIRANPAFMSLTGLTEDATKEVQDSVFDHDTLLDINARLETLKLTGGSIAFETELKSAHGTIRYISWTASITPTEVPGDEKIVCTGIDITERYEAQEQLAFLALHDPLTQCYNRNHLTTALETSIERVSEGESCALISIDLDSFKAVNDTAGHMAGDRLLISLAAIFRECTREGDDIIRFGGDEFIIVLNDIDPDSTRFVAERIRHRVAEVPFIEGDHQFPVTVSVGVAMIEPGLSAERAIAQVDAACYAAKSAGRNQVKIYEDAHDRVTLMKSDINWTGRVRTAIQDDNFALLYQPISDIKTGKVVFHEALLRMKDSSGNLIAPINFLPSAERFKITPKVDRYVVGQIAYRLRNDSHLQVSVNLSAQSLGEPEFADFIEETFRHIPRAANRVCFEITETAVIADLESARQIINQLHRLGFRFALDDFGTGFTCFDYLKNLPVDYVKIDGSFIVDLATHPVNHAFVNGINQIAHELGMKTVAEYVETNEVLQILHHLRVDYAQGFLIGKPVPH